MKMGLKVNQIKKIIYDLQTLTKASKKVQKSLSNVRRKLDIHHDEWLAEFAKDYQLSRFIRSDALACLLRSFPDLDSICLSSVGNTLHRNLRLSLKKLGGTNIKKVRPKSQHNLVKSVKLLIISLKYQHYLIFIYEFTVNWQTQWTYGWTKKGKHGRKLVWTLDFKMSFIMAHSQVKIEGIIGQVQLSIKWSKNSFLVSSFQIWSRMSNWIIKSFHRWRQLSVPLNRFNETATHSCKALMILHPSLFAINERLREADKFYQKQGEDNCEWGEVSFVFNNKYDC